MHQFHGEPGIPPEMMNKLRLVGAGAFWVIGWLVSLAATVYGYGLHIESMAWLAFGAFGSTLSFLVAGEILRTIER